MTVHETEGSPGQPSYRQASHPEIQADHCVSVTAPAYESQRWDRGEAAMTVWLALARIVQEAA